MARMAAETTNKGDAMKMSYMGDVSEAVREVLAKAAATAEAYGDDVARPLMNDGDRALVIASRDIAAAIRSLCTS